MAMIAALHERLHPASIESNPSNEEEKAKATASLGTLAVLNSKIRERIWHYATLGFPIPIHDVDWVQEPKHPPSFLNRIKSLAIFHQPHMDFPFLLTSKMINEEAKDELYKHNYSIAFTMSPPEDMDRTYSDINTPVYVGDVCSSASQECRVDYFDIEKTDFRRFARVTFIIQGPDGIPRDWKTSKKEQIRDLRCKAVIPGYISLWKQKLRELVLRFENGDGWVWKRNEDLREFNNYFMQPNYGVDGKTDQLTDNNARGTLERPRSKSSGDFKIILKPSVVLRAEDADCSHKKCLDTFNGLHGIEKFVVELPASIDIDNRLFRYITKGSRAYGGGHDHTVVKSANGKVHVFKYDQEGKLIPQSRAPSFLKVGKKEPWKLYESQESTGNELGGG